MPESKGTRPPGTEAEEQAAPSGLLPLLAVLIFVVMMDNRVITPVLSQIADDLGSSVVGVGVALTAY